MSTAAPDDDSPLLSTAVYITTNDDLPLIPAIAVKPPSKSLDKVSLLMEHRLAAKVSKDLVVHERNGFPREEWEVKGVIGSGEFAPVILQQKRGTLDLRAVKRIATLPRRKLRQDVLRELADMNSMMDRPDLFVRFLGWYEDDNLLFYAMEYLEHGNLQQYIIKHPHGASLNSRKISEQILKGLDVLHSRKICHQNLKPHNILIASLSPIQVKLADFGISKRMATNKWRTTHGAKDYTDLELLWIYHRGPSTKSNYNNAADMWAFGCLVYLLLTGEQPFMSNGHLNIHIFNKFCLRQVNYFDKFFDTCVTEVCALDFVRKLLVPDECQRMAASEALNHPWIINPRPEEHKHSLFWAAENGHLAVVELLVNRGDVEADSKDRCGRTPLSLAAGNGHLAVVELLVNRDDVEADSKGHYGRTPLSIAAENGHLAVVGLLVNRNDAEADSKDRCGRTPLSLAAENGYLAVVELLVNRDNVEADSKDHYGQTPLYFAAGNGHLGVVKLLVNRGNVEADSKSCYGRTPLSFAAENGYLAVVELLVNRGDVKTDPKDDDNRTPLSLAAENGHLAVVELLMNRNDVEADPKDDNNRTSLSFAAENGHLAVVELLVNRGDVEADPKDDSNRTPLSFAAENGHLAVVELLVNRGDVEADSKDHYGQTPLSFAAENGHLVVVELLVNRDDVEADSKSYYGRTPLSFAAGNGHLVVVELLVNRGDVETDSKDYYGQTPLSFAAENEHLAVVEILVNRGDVEADSKSDYYDRTPLFSAAKDGHLEVVKLLDNRDDVDPDSKNSNCQIQLSLAAENRHLMPLAPIPEAHRSPLRMRLGAPMPEEHKPTLPVPLAPRLEEHGPPLPMLLDAPILEEHKPILTTPLTRILDEDESTLPTYESPSPMDESLPPVGVDVPILEEYESLFPALLAPIPEEYESLFPAPLAPISEERKVPLIMPLTTPTQGGIKPLVEEAQPPGPWTHGLLVGACSGIRFELYCLNWFDKVGAWVEQKLGTPIDWWPLNPPVRSKEFDMVRMSWKCTCGATLSSVISTELAERYQRLCAHSSPGGTVSGIASTVSGSGGSQALNRPSTRPSTVLTMNGRLASQQSATAAPGTHQSVQSSINLSIFILCCIKQGPRRTVLAQVAKTPAMNDREFFWNLRREYYRIRGWRGWIRLSTVERIKFVRFTRYYLDYVDCYEPEELPPHTNSDYEYIPKPPDNPPMLPVEEFLHYFDNPDCAGTATNCLDLIPKRVVGRLGSGNRVVAWGLQPREGLSLWESLFLLIFFWVGTLVFAIWWLVRHPGDLQNAFVPATYAIGLAAICVILPGVLSVYK